MIGGKHCGADNYSMARYVWGREFIDDSLNCIRKLKEQCDNFEGYFVYNSINGATGSGITALLNERLHRDDFKKPLFQFSIFPSKDFSNSVVEPINNVLCFWDIV